VFILDPGCTIPVQVTYTPTQPGEMYGALLVETVQQEQGEDESSELPDYLRDPVHWKQMVYLHGESTASQGALVVRPRAYDFGFVHPSDVANMRPARIEVANVGEGDVTLTSAELDSGCDPAYSINYMFPAGTVLEGGASTLVEVAFRPTDTDAAYCQLFIRSDDPANARVDVNFSGNTGTDTKNEPPTVFIRTPQTGFRYNAIRPLRLELNLFDVNQPAPTLVCKVKSAIVQETIIASCTAPDESGHVFVDIPAENFRTGVDTLTVTVTDASQASAYASVSVLVNADYPSDDDDGDGFSPSAETNADCDDHNPLTYPQAAEVFDALDNDCDGVADEGTNGYDDDGDGYAEAQGDCNDYDRNTYPGAPERGDALDNDCDAVVDEGTSLYDDDGDGFAEVNNDCNDSNPNVNPSAREVCDSLDNDCDGLRDSADGCVATDSQPVIVGDALRAEQNACETGDTVRMDVLVFDADGQTPTYQWQDDCDMTFDNAAAPVVNWTCPEVGRGSSGKRCNIYVIAVDPDGNQAWAFDPIEVRPKGFGLYDPYSQLVEATSGGCSALGGSGTGWLGLGVAGLALASLARRRR